MSNFVVQTELVLKSNVVAVLASLSREMAGFDRLILSTNANLDRLTSSLRKLGATDRVVARLAVSLDKIKAASAGSNLGTEFDHAAASMRSVLTTTEALSKVLRDNAKLAADQAAAMARAASAGTRNPASPSRTPSTTRHGQHGTGGLLGHDAMLAGMGMAGVGHGAMSLAEHAIHASFEAQKVQAQLGLNNNFTPAHIAQARQEAERVARAVPGTTIAGNLEIIRHGFANLGDSHEAIQSTEAMAKMGRFFAMMDRQRGGNGDQDRAIDNAFKFIEDTGLGIDRSDPAHPHVTREKIEGAAEMIQRIYAGTQGRIGPTELFNFIKQARGAGVSLSAEGLMHYAPVMAALGSSRAGTALSSAFQQFQVGRMTQQTFNELQQAGVYDSTAKWKGGRVIDASRHLANRELGLHDPMKWIDTVITPYLTRIGAMTTAADGSVAAGNLAGRTTTWGLLVEALVAKAQVDKQYANINNTVRDPYDQLQRNDPTARIAAFRASENEFMVAMGDFLAGPAVTVLTTMTDTLHKITDWAKAHPDIAGYLSQFAVGLGVITGAIGAAMLGLMPWLAIARLMGAGGAAASGASAAGSASTGAAAAGGLSAVALGTLASAGIAAVMGGAGAAAGHLNVTMVDDQGNPIGNWGGEEGERNQRIQEAARQARIRAEAEERARQVTWQRAPETAFDARERAIENLARQRRFDPMRTPIDEPYVVPQTPIRLTPASQNSPLVTATQQMAAAASELARVGPPPTVQQTVQVRTSIQLDSRTIGEMVSEHILRMGERAPASSASFDPRMGNPQPTTPFY